MNNKQTKLSAKDLNDRIRNVLNSITYDLESGLYIDSILKAMESGDVFEQESCAYFFEPEYSGSQIPKTRIKMTLKLQIMDDEQ